MSRHENRAENHEHDGRQAEHLFAGNANDPRCRRHTQVPCQDDLAGGEDAEGDAKNHYCGKASHFWSDLIENFKERTNISITVLKSQVFCSTVY